MEEAEKKKNWFARHKILTGIIVVIVLIAIGSSTSSNTTNKNSSDNQTQVKSSGKNTPAATEKSAQKDITPKVGDVTKLGDREFVVNSVRRSGAFNYNTPKVGKEYVIINVTIRNLGKDEISYNPYDFKIQDANGAQESETFAALDDSLNSGTLAPGGKVTGSMPFQVPVGDKALLIFQPSFWSSQRVVVDLGTK